jgi:hypothetical protein
VLHLLVQVRVEEARTKNLYLRNTLRKLEAQVGAKETLADSGLALIDFEQLKIENQVWFCFGFWFLTYNFDSGFVVSCVCMTFPMIIFFEDT